jgi:hypothetical protein
MHLKLFRLLLLFLFLPIVQGMAQDNVERPMPAMITHLTAAHRDILRIKDAPKHNIFQKFYVFRLTVVEKLVG